jgi:hypothetical protein
MHDYFKTYAEPFQLHMLEQQLQLKQHMTLAATKHRYYADGPSRPGEQSRHGRQSRTQQ